MAARNLIDSEDARSRAAGSFSFIDFSDACGVYNPRWIVNKMGFVRTSIELFVAGVILWWYIGRRRLALTQNSPEAASYIVLPNYVGILYFTFFLVCISCLYFLT